MSAALPHIDTPDPLRRRALAGVPRGCDCLLRRCGASRESAADGRWPNARMTAVATLRDPALVADAPTPCAIRPHLGNPVIAFHDDNSLNLG